VSGLEPVKSGLGLSFHGFWICAVEKKTLGFFAHVSLFWTFCLQRAKSCAVPASLQQHPGAHLATRSLSRVVVQNSSKFGRRRTSLLGSLALFPNQIFDLVPVSPFFQPLAFPRISTERELSQDSAVLPWARAIPAT